MRKNAGFMILTLLLLTVPALANAWTLAVKVAGGTDTNNVSVAYGTPAVSRSFKSTSSYLYPVGAITITDNAAASSITFDGATYVPATFVSPTSGNHTLAVTYSTTQSASGLTLAQANGGTIYAMNQNNTWTTTGVSGLVAGASVTVAIAADANHNIVSYNVNGTSVTVNGAAGQVLQLPASANNQTVSAVFGLVGKVSASLFAPTTGVSATAIALSVTATSNDTGLLYSFSTDGGSTFSTPSATATFSFTPAAAGNYAVVAKVTSANGGVFITPAATVVVADTVASANQGCESCHSTQSPTIVANYTASIHGESSHSACSACHTAATPHSAGVNTLNIDTKGFFTYTSNVTGPKGAVAKGAIFCTQCHSTIPHQTTNLATGITCNVCHTSTNGKGGTGDAHAVQGTSCVGCHSVGQSNPFTDKTLVNDNAGVRAVTGEFTKWSHHIVNAPGVAIQDEQCAVCHLEGTVGAYGFGVDGTKHMTDNMTHLRNAHDDSDMQWNPAAPNHSTMDNFCMACHSATGATSPMNLKLQALISTGITASPLNPFGDTISNRYDKMQRPAVTNVDNQFDTANNSHHGVKGARYSGRTRLAGPRQIASAATFANNSTPTLQGVRSTIYDAGNFNALYTPLANAAGEAAPRTGAASLGDDSTLHCGDCHTVGQWKVGSTVNAAGVATTVAIGAHGSNNEYMLRNSIGTDERHTQNAYTSNASNVVSYNNPNGAFLVCYNCHAYKNYGSVFVGTGADAGNAAGNPLSNIQSHAGEYASAGRCNGPGNTLSFAGYTTGAGTDGTQFESRIKGLGAKAAGEQSADFGNALGIQCLNCHNSGLANAYGGIHGSAKNTSWNGINPAAAVTGGAYIDGMGNTTKVERFLPGLGNAMHVPGTLGGFTGGTNATGHQLNTDGSFATTYTYTTGGISNDTNWEQKDWQQTATTVINFKTAGVSNTANVGAGCYTLGETALPANVTAGLAGPSVTGAGGPATEASGTWGGCDDHTGAQGGGNHGFLKRIVRPVTY